MARKKNINHLSVQSLYNQGISQAEIAKKYGITQSSVSKIVNKNKDKKKNYGRKMTIEKAREIRKLYSTDKYTQAQIAYLYNITQAMAGRIINHQAHRETHMGFVGISDVAVWYNYEN